MLMKYLALVPMAIFSLALQGQTGSVANGGPQAAQQVTSVSISAELTKRIDTKYAKQGDEVDARVTSNVKLPDGTELPRGTKLIGKVTNVKAKSKEDKSSHLAFNIDHAVLKDGKDVPVMVAVLSMTGPAQSSAGEAMAPGGMAGGGGGAAGGGGMTSGGGGMAGGGSARSSAPAATSTTSAPSGPIMDNSGQPQSTAGVLKNAQDRVPVGNMPGVMLSGGGNSGSGGSLDASGDNISLDSGTKLMLRVAAGGSTAGQ
jgi:hypothetical protein